MDQKAHSLLFTLFSFFMCGAVCQTCLEILVLVSYNIHISQEKSARNNEVGFRVVDRGDDNSHHLTASSHLDTARLS